MRKTLLQRICSAIVVSTFKRYKSREASKMTLFTQVRNPITGSSEWGLQAEDYDYHQEIARSAFADMLHDTERNRKYHRALRLAIDNMHKAGKQANVLDIGTGTGLLSIMAVRCGANSVVACEAFKPMADCCVKILEKNGVADKITVIPKRSTELTVGENGDMKQKANILVTEVFDTELIGEGALHTFSHAHEHLLEAGSIVIPSSATIYAQVVNCPTLQSWNKLHDLYDEEAEVNILKTPRKMKNCPGTAAIHDLQLSELARHTFIELSDEIPVLGFDWTGRAPLPMNRTNVQRFKVVNPGKAHAVFMWWELKMDTDGQIRLSCAPWWCHPRTRNVAERPQDTIPWRDHWMQGVYYLPKEMTLYQFTTAKLIACQDEYSIWFYLENDKYKATSLARPVCDCGVHMALSRTHVGYLNDSLRNFKFLTHLKDELKQVKDPVVLDLNGSSFLGLAAAKLGAKKVYIVEKSNLTRGILTDYMIENNIENVEFLTDVEDGVLKETSMVVCDPNFTTAILPWENLKMAHMLYKFRDVLSQDVRIIPGSCQFWAMPVEFQNLHKIRVPLGSYEGIDFSVFDELVENSRIISDEEVEAQPLWEYPCRCRGEPQKLLELDMRNLQPRYANDGAHHLCKQENIKFDYGDQTINGFVLWTVWRVGNKGFSTGPTGWPNIGEMAYWYHYTRQAIKILKKSYTLKCSEKWNFQVTCDLEKGHFNVKFDLVTDEGE